jgi:DNA polymerase-3 subunit beta
MRIEIQKNKLDKHIGIVSKAIIQHPALYSLSGIYLEATESYLELIASNGNFSIKERIDLDSDIRIVEPGKILINGYLMKNIVKKQKGKIEIYVQDNFVVFESDEIKTNINSLNIEEYPKISFINTGSKIVFNKEDFKRALKNVVFAASENDKRIILNGVNLKTVGGKLYFSATNSYRFAIDSIPVEKEKDIDITIFSKNIKEFLPTEITNNSIEITVEDRKINFLNNETIIQSKLIDGDYPNLLNLVPSTYESTLKINSTDLINLIEKITVIHNSFAPIKLRIENNEMTLETRKEEIGNAKVKTTNFSYDGENFEITFDSNFMKEALKTFNSKEVDVNFSGKTSPITINNPENSDLIQLILPHRVF